MPKNKGYVNTGHDYYSAPEPEPEPIEEAEAETPVQSGAYVPQYGQTQSIQKIVELEKDLAPKYSEAGAAAKSVMDGDYYEDYARGESAGLLKCKDFVLAALAQNPLRFYAPETPKPSDWIDEEYLSARLSFFFDESKENLNAEETAVLGEIFFQYLFKNAFSPEVCNIITTLSKNVGKIKAAAVTFYADGERLKGSINNYSSGINGALAIAKNKYLSFAETQKQKAEILAALKAELTEKVEAMVFEL